MIYRTYFTTRGSNQSHRKYLTSISWRLIASLDLLIAVGVVYLAIVLRVIYDAEIIFALGLLIGYLGGRVHKHYVRRR